MFDEIMGEKVAGSGKNWTLQNEPEPQESLRLFAKFNPQGSLRIYDFTLSGKVLTTQRSFQAGDLSADYYYEGET
ncbi:MAG: hypothetical protein KGH96_23630 [Sphingomonadales bacterium]|nr:hypothetical protein [Sphingomonadales bacterium]